MTDRMQLIADLGRVLADAQDRGDERAAATLRAAFETMVRDTSAIEREARRRQKDKARKPRKSVDSTDSVESVESVEFHDTPSPSLPPLDPPAPPINPSFPPPPLQQQLPREAERQAEPVVLAEPVADGRIAESERELVRLLVADRPAERAAAERVVADFIAAAKPASRYAWVRSLVAVLEPLGGKAMAPAVLYRAMHDFLVADRAEWPFSGRVFRAFVDATAEAMAREARGEGRSDPPRSRGSPGPRPISTSAALREWAARVDGASAPTIATASTAAPDPSTLTRSA